jgi:hypothetical protein
MTTDQKIKRVYFLDKEIKKLKALYRACMRFKSDEKYMNNIDKTIRRFTNELKTLLPDDTKKR